MLFNAFFIISTIQFDNSDNSDNLDKFILFIIKVTMVIA